MNFNQLMRVAEGNHSTKTKSNLLNTKISRAKKEKRNKDKLSVNVQKFLEKKEAEERQKKLEAKLQREKLNELRSDRDKNKIAKHLKVTKSANYAVLSDAVDKKDTSITLKGRKQCDEDDYGFASQTSQGLYEKLICKYEADPEDPMAKFSRSKPKQMVDIASVKERVKEALRKEEENPIIPGKRRRNLNDSEKIQPGCSAGNRSLGKPKDSSNNDREDREEKERQRKKDEERKAKSDKEKKEEEARKKRSANAKKAPPPVNFNDLMDMAEELKYVPVKVEKNKIVKEFEFGARPMTEQEKKEFMREKESRLRKEGKLPPKEKVPDRKEGKSPELDLRDTRKKEKSPEVDLRESRKVKPAEPGPMFHKAVRKSMPEVKKPVVEEQSRAMSEYEREKREMERKMKELEEKTKLGEMQTKYKEMQRKMKEMEARLGNGSKGDGGSKSSSSSSKRDPHNVQARHFPGEKKKDRGRRDNRGSSSYKRRIESDSEDEYDSEMDDFIDDSEAKVDISKEIRSIFGYDKRKYRDESDEDDRSMENNRFSSIMMEEVRSARIGRQEDLEDMRREEEENKRKKKRR